MPARDPRRNRGPAAAAGNRAALLAAGREQFAAHGYDVPLSAVARAAGVSQGVLYRHFPSRVALALAVFSDNMDELEEGAARLGDDPDGSHLAVVVGRLLTMTLASAAFVDLAIHASEQPDIDAIPRLRALVDAPLERARRHGRVRPDLDERRRAAAGADGVRDRHDWGDQGRRGTCGSACRPPHGSLAGCAPSALGSGVVLNAMRDASHRHGMVLTDTNVLRGR